MHMLRIPRTTLLTSCLLIASAGLPSVVEARELRINSLADTTSPAFCAGGTSPCTLRRAFELADHNPGEFFTAHIDVRGAFFLNSQLVLRRGSLRLTSTVGDAAVNRIDGQNKTRLILIDPEPGFFPSLRIERMRLTRGNASFGPGGAVFVNSNGRFEATDSIIQSNMSSGLGSGVAVNPNGRLTLFRTVVAYNINEQSTGTGCPPQAGQTGLGGGVAALQGRVTIHNSLFHNNRSCRGGGIFVQDGNVNITNTTFIRNVADGKGGGILINGTNAPAQRRVSLIFNTITENTASLNCCDGDLKHGGGLVLTNYSGELLLSGNIIARNTLKHGDGRVLAAIQTHGADCLMEQSSPSINSYLNIFGTAGSGTVNRIGLANVNRSEMRQISDCVPLSHRSLAGWDASRLKPFPEIQDPNDPSKLLPLVLTGYTGPARVAVVMPTSGGVANRGFSHSPTATDHLCQPLDGRWFWRPMASAGVCDVGAAELNGTELAW